VGFLSSALTQALRDRFACAGELLRFRHGESVSGRLVAGGRRRVGPVDIGTGRGRFDIALGDRSLWARSVDPGQVDAVLLGATLGPRRRLDVRRGRGVSVGPFAALRRCSVATLEEVLDIAFRDCILRPGPVDSRQIYVCFVGATLGPRRRLDVCSRRATVGCYTVTRFGTRIRYRLTGFRRPLVTLSVVLEFRHRRYRLSLLTDHREGLPHFDSDLFAFLDVLFEQDSAFGSLDVGAGLIRLEDGDDVPSLHGVARVGLPGDEISVVTQPELRNAYYVYHIWYHESPFYLNSHHTQPSVSPRMSHLCKFSKSTDRRNSERAGKARSPSDRPQKSDSIPSAMRSAEGSASCSRGGLGNRDVLHADGLRRRVEAEEVVLDDLVRDVTLRPVSLDGLVDDDQSSCLPDALGDRLGVKRGERSGG